MNEEKIEDDMPACLSLMKLLVISTSYFDQIWFL
jgi:hypothetical protein